MHSDGIVTHGGLMILVLALAGGCASGPSRSQTSFTLQPGDLLFQDGDAGDFAEAIEAVTWGYNGSKFTHVGVVVQVGATDAQGNQSATILEAVSAGVKLTPLPEYLDRSTDADGFPKVIVGRLKPEYRSLIPSGIAFGITLRGKPYDQMFVVGNDQYYCSELVYEMFRSANGGEPVFELQPMTFKEPDTAETFHIWVDYYRRLGVRIPEGEPGLNPGGISRSDKIDIVHIYGIPTGWEN